MNEPDFRADEIEFRREIAPPLAEIQSAAGRCPDPDRLMAAMSGVQLDDAAAILEHASLCPLCTQLSRDLTAHEFPGASEAEDRRIRARFPAPERRGTASAWSWLWRPVPAAAICAAAILLIAVGLRRNSPAPNSSVPAETAHTPPVVPGPILALQKAAIKVPAAAVLIYRGTGPDGQAYLKDLAAALEPYRRGDYAESERALDVLSAKYPNRAEPDFYLGVSRLFLNRNDAALESLRRARAHADATLRDDSSWYLAIASERAGNVPNALKEVAALCERPGEYKENACAAVERLKAK
jgi:hypothetical protein